LGSRNQVNAQSLAPHEVDVADHMMRWKRREEIRSGGLGWLPGLRPHACTEKHQHDHSETHISHGQKCTAVLYPANGENRGMHTLSFWSMP
jgi:hypothetical protein